MIERSPDTGPDEGVATNGDIELYTLAEGPVDGPAVVLVNGLGSTCVMWDRHLIDPLVAAGHRVIRFDNRDVGRSTRIDREVRYDLTDMAHDLFAVLDHWQVDTAHVVARSMGGAITLEAVLADGARINTMTMIFTSAALLAHDETGLPGPESWAVENMVANAQAPEPPTIEDRIVRRCIETEIYSGTRYPFDAEWARAEAEADIAHAPHARHRHGQALAATPHRLAELPSIATPALVLHGDADPIVPIDHGRALAAGLAVARLIEYRGLAHEMPPAWCDEIVPEILNHIGTSHAS